MSIMCGVSGRFYGTNLDQRDVLCTALYSAFFTEEEVQSVQ